MRRVGLSGFWLVVLAGSPAIVAAQAPLSVEQLIMQAARWQAGVTTEFRSAQLALGERRDATATATLRYGLRPDLEVNAALRRTRSRSPIGTDAATTGLGLGVTWQVHREHRWPALVLEGRLDAAAAGAGPSGLAGAALAATAYRSIDPVVLSLTVAYAGQRSHAEQGVDVAPGPVLRLEPTINFAVNPEVTLFGGMGLARRGETRLDGRRATPAQHSVTLRGGLAWAPRPRTTLFLSAELANAAGLGGVSLRWLKDF